MDESLDFGKWIPRLVGNLTWNRHSKCSLEFFLKKAASSLFPFKVLDKISFNNFSTYL